MYCSDVKMEWGKTVLMKKNHMNFALFGSFIKMDLKR